MSSIEFRGLGVDGGIAQRAWWRAVGLVQRVAEDSQRQALDNAGRATVSMTRSLLESGMVTHEVEELVAQNTVTGNTPTTTFDTDDIKTIEDSLNLLQDGAHISGGEFVAVTEDPRVVTARQLAGFAAVGHSLNEKADIVQAQ